MDYELAKQLKDAGFPQEENGNGFFCNEQLCGRNYDDCDQEIVRIPTLDELTDACEEDFISLSRDDGGKFSCLTRHGFVYNGKTKEEAVANAFLGIKEWSSDTIK